MTGHPAALLRWPTLVGFVQKGLKLRSREIAPGIWVMTFPDRASWLEARRLVVTASDVAAVLGMDSARSRWSVWEEKVNGSPRKIDPDMEEAVRWGSLLEEAIAGECGRRLGRRLIDPGRWSLTINLSLEAPLAASLDRIIDPARGRWVELDAVADAWRWENELSDGPKTPDGKAPFDIGIMADPDPRGMGVLEVKNVNEFLAREAWDDEDGPVEKIVQLQTQLAVTGFQYGVLAGLAGGRKLVPIEHPRDEAFIAWMIDQVRRFWWHVETKEPPPVDGSDSTANALARHYSKGGLGATELPAAALLWADALDLAEKQAKEAEARAQEMKNRLKAALGDYEVGALPGTDGSTGFRWSPVRASVTKCPKCAETVGEKSAHRRLVKFPKARKEKIEADTDGAA